MSGRHAPFFFVSGADLDLPALTLRGEDARHLSKVRRAKPGDVVAGSDGAGRMFEAKITTAGQSSVSAEIVRTWSVEQRLPRLCVLQGLAKQDKNDAVVRMLVEVGIDEITIFCSERSIPRWEERKADEMRGRWERIAMEAAKQSHRAWLPAVTGPLAFDEAAATAADAEISIVGAPTSATSLRDALAAETPSSVSVVVGPEGGLSDQELDLLAGLGVVRVTLGEQILRTQTAGIAMVSAVAFRYGLLG